MIVFVSVFITIKYKEISKIEWKMIMELLYNTVVYKFFDNQSFFSIFYCFSKICNNIKKNSFIINKIKAMVNLLCRKEIKIDNKLNEIFSTLIK